MSLPNEMPPIGREDFKPISPSVKPQELQPEVLGKDSNRLEVEKFLLENVPKALKNSAKIIMKVLTAPPALALDFGGGVLKNAGFFMRAVPMALGKAIGEKIGKGLGGEAVYTAPGIGKWVGFAIASPITVPALGVELVGRLAQFAGNLHIKANIKEELDLGVYLKHQFLSQPPVMIRDNYVKELLKKDPMLSEKEINEKIQFKFRNQASNLRDIKYTDDRF